MGWASMCGKRPDMQDSMCVLSGFMDDPNNHFAAIFDGHSGPHVSRVVVHWFSLLISSSTQLHITRTY